MAWVIPSLRTSVVRQPSPHGQRPPLNQNVLPRARSASISAARGGVMRPDGTYDLVVLGSGPAGDSAAQLAANAGFRVAIVERLRAPGGVVVANGGVPTKTLRETAMYLTGFMDRHVYGLGLSLDRQVLAEKLSARM